MSVGRILPILAAAMLAISANAAEAQLIAPGNHAAKKSYVIERALPSGLPQGTHAALPKLTLAMPTSRVPYADWDIRYRERPDGDHEYDWASAATVLRKLGAPLGPQIQRIDLYGADGGGFAKLTLNMDWLSGSSRTRLPD